MTAREVIYQLHKEVDAEISKIHDEIRKDKREGTMLEIGILGGYSAVDSMLRSIKDKIEDEEDALNLATINCATNEINSNLMIMGVDMADSEGFSVVTISLDSLLPWQREQILGQMFSDTKGGAVCPQEPKQPIS